MSAPLPGAEARPGALAGSPARAAAPPEGEARRQNFLLRYFGRFDDGELVRCAFGGLLAGALVILAMDLNDLWHRAEWAAPEAALPGFDAPAVLPPALETGGPETEGGQDPRPFLHADDAALRAPMRFTLEKGGVLGASGTIDIDAADRFRAEIDARGEYVKTVSLNSPGGSLGDAMAMARLIRERKLDTRVEDGALCASSCPLAMAGGVRRSAGAKAAVGVHQFYAVAAGEAPAVQPAQAMADAQATTATISRLLGEMGVDPALWLHALDTPPRALYYLSPTELAKYRLVTDAAPVAEAPR